MKALTYYSQRISFFFNPSTFISLLLDIFQWRLEMHWSNKSCDGGDHHYLRLRLMHLPCPRAGWYETKWQWIRGRVFDEEV